MSYRHSPKIIMCGLKSHAKQRGVGQWWMILTVGIMVGFIFGFILFLSRLPDDHYTLVETTRGVEQISSSDADQYAFYDRLAEQRSLVPDASADDLPAFQRERGTGSYGANADQRPTAVELADDLNINARAVEVAAAASGAVDTIQRSTSATGNNTLVIRQPTGNRSTTTVRKEIVRPSTSYYLQAGAFAEGGDAARLRQRLTQSGMDAFIKKGIIEGKQWHRVRIGPFYDAKSLNTAQTKLGQNGISYLVIKVQS